MQSLTPEQFYARSLVYHALAEALYEPAAGVQESLMEAATAGAQSLASPACRKAALRLATVPTATPGQLRQRYIRVTRNGGQRPLAVYESLHREGRLMGQATRAAEQRYRSLGISPDDGELPDHASVELAFLGHLAAAQGQASAAIDKLQIGRLRKEERTFLREHPGGWLPDVGKVLAAVDDPFYAAVGALLSEFLTEELTGSRARQTKRSGLPVLVNADSCNLCGLCTGVCQPNALRVVENDTETALALDITRCVGCDRCIHTCPQGVLVESAVGAHPQQNGTSGVTGVHILRRSPRAQCPICGHPTVSQAELEAVFSALEPDPMMQRQMSLCVECKSLWNSW